MEHRGAEPSLSPPDRLEPSTEENSALEHNVLTIRSPNVLNGTPPPHSLADQIEQAWDAAIDAPEVLDQPPDIANMSGLLHEEETQTYNPERANQAASSPNPSNMGHGLRASVGSLLHRWIGALTSTLFHHHETRPTDQGNSASERAESVGPAPGSGDSATTPAPNPRASTDPHVSTTSDPAHNSDASTPLDPPSTDDDASDLPRPPQFLMYIPQDVSPFPFGFLYDAGSSMAWPILDQFERTDSQESEGPRRTVHVLGRPFRLTVTVNARGPQEEVDIDKARNYVKGLEVIDADLRVRMQHLGMSDISEYGDVGDDHDSGCVPGCCVCLEPYPNEDKPSWLFDEEQELMGRIVALPCAGFHTIHGACIFHWLKSKPPSKWTCPYCRSALDPDHPTLEVGKTKNKPLTMREFVRLEERRSGWRCDAPACLPSYETDTRSSHMIQLFPCRHQIHLDCLCTCMRVQRTETRLMEDHDHYNYDEEEDDSDCESDNVHDTSRMTRSEHLSSHHETMTPRSGTIGKWVTCAACRKDAWAELPTRRRPRPRHELYAHLSKSTEL